MSKKGERERIEQREKAARAGSINKRAEGHMIRLNK